MPLAWKPKRVMLPDGSPPPSKRRSLSSGPQQQQSGPLRASPIKSKQFSFGQVKVRPPKDKDSDTPVVQLHWPVSYRTAKNFHYAKISSNPATLVLKKYFVE